MYQKFIDKKSEGNFTNGLEYFAVGLISESYLKPDGSGNESGKDFVVEFFDPFGEHHIEWRAAGDITVSEISESDYQYIRQCYDQTST